MGQRPVGTAMHTDMRSVVYLIQRFQHSSKLCGTDGAITASGPNDTRKPERKQHRLGRRRRGRHNSMWLIALGELMQGAGVIKTTYPFLSNSSKTSFSSASSLAAYSQNNSGNTKRISRGRDSTKPGNAHLVFESDTVPFKDTTNSTFQANLFFLWSLPPEPSSCRAKPGKQDTGKIIRYQVHTR